MSQLNGTFVTRYTGTNGSKTIFVPLPKEQWRIALMDGKCGCNVCKGDNGQTLAFWDTLVVSAEPIEGQPDLATVCHYPELHAQFVRITKTEEYRESLKPKESFNGSKMLRDAMRKSEFLTAYVEALFFTEVTPDSDEEMKEKDAEDVSFSLARQLIHDCAIFEAAHDREIDSAYASAGHDFWLTRNGHGAGFWDGDWPKEEGERMDATSKSFGECEIYAGDDGLLYAS